MESLDRSKTWYQPEQHSYKSTALPSSPHPSATKTQPLHNKVSPTSRILAVGTLSAISYLQSLSPGLKLPGVGVTKSEQVERRGRAEEGDHERLPVLLHYSSGVALGNAGIRKDGEAGRGRQRLQGAKDETDIKVWERELGCCCRGCTVQSSHRE